MGSSSQRTEQSAVGPGKAQLASLGPGRVEESYQFDMNNPDRTAPMAQRAVGRMLQPEFLDPRNNPFFSGAMADIMGQGQQRAQSMFGLAGRGNSNNASGAGGYFADQFSRAAMPTLANMFQQNQGMQQQAAGMAGAIDATQSLPLEQWLERNRNMALLDQKGKTTQSMSPLQTIAGAGLSIAGGLGSLGYKPFA